MNHKLQIELYMLEPEVTVLGPGKRYAVWVQGCRRNCPGCIAGNSHRAEDGFLMSTYALAQEILLSKTTGITISGGEPFLQAEPLTEMLELVKQKRNLGVIIYTGYLFEELKDVPFADKLLQYTDLLIDGPYVSELDDGLSLRGSSNQRVIPLTDRYLEDLPMYGSEERLVQEFNHGMEIHHVGIPNESYANTKKNTMEDKS